MLSLEVHIKNNCHEVICVLSEDTMHKIPVCSKPFWENYWRGKLHQRWELALNSKCYLVIPMRKQEITRGFINNLTIEAFMQENNSQRIYHVHNLILLFGEILSKKDILTSSKTKLGPWDNWFTTKWSGYQSSKK